MRRICNSKGTSHVGNLKNVPMFSEPQHLASKEGDSPGGTGLTETDHEEQRVGIKLRIRDWRRRRAGLMIRWGMLGT